MKLLFDDENSRCLEVDSPLQTLLFFLFSSKLSSEYKRIFVGPFLQCEFIFSGFLGLPDEFRQNSTLERRGCESSPTKFQGVWKLTDLFRLFHSSSFRASFPVSTKEFLWDLSLNVNLFFQVFLAFKPDEFCQNLTRERRGCESSPTPTPSLS